MKTVNGLPVFTYGNENNIPVVFVHGFTFNNNMWNYQVEFLKKDFYCITYDIRGLGKSDVRDGQYTMEMFVDDLFEIIKELKLNKPILAGLSMGGYLSFRAVEKNPELFRGLIFLDTRADADTNQAKLKRAAGIKQINEEGLDKFIDGFLPNCFSDEFKKTNEYQTYLQSSKKLNPLGVKGCLLAMQGRTSTAEFLSQIKVPVLVICGEKDVLSPVEEMKKMQEKIPNSEFCIVPAAGHMTPVEKPDFVNKTIARFLKNFD